MGVILCSMSGRRSLFAQVLDAGYAPLGIYIYLAKKWAVPEAPQEFTTSRSFRSNTESASRDINATGFPVLEALGALVSRGDEGLGKLALLAVNEEGLVSVLQYIFRLGRAPTKTSSASSLLTATTFLPLGSPQSCDSKRPILQ